MSDIKKRADEKKDTFAKDAGGPREAGTLVGAASGAAAGAFAGPVGALIGGAVGTALGYIAGEVMEEDDRRHEAREQELDEGIGVYNGPIGAKASDKHPESVRPEPGEGITSKALLREIELEEEEEEKKKAEEKGSST